MNERLKHLPKAVKGSVGQQNGENDEKQKKKNKFVRINQFPGLE